MVLCSGSCRGLSLAEKSSSHPPWRDENVGGAGEKRRLIAFNQMTQPCQGEGGGYEEQPNYPMKPDDNQSGKADGDGNEMQSAVYRMIVRTVVMRLQAHDCTSDSRRIISRTEWK